MAEYDKIAAAYKGSKTLPFRMQIEAYTISRLAGDLTNLKVLDLACGEGFQTRALKRAGAASVLGIDVSCEMISLAKEAEKAEPTGCRYRQSDAADLDLEETF